MHGDHLGTGILRRAGDDRRVQGVVVPAEPHLDGERDGDGVVDCVEDATGKFGFTHERRTGAAAGHILRGAAEVDVDDVGAEGLALACGGGHALGVAAVNLDGDGVLVRVELGHVPGIFDVAGESLGRDELCDGKPAAAEGADGGPEGPVGDALHGGEDDGGVDADGADREGFGGCVHGGGGDTAGVGEAQEAGGKVVVGHETRRTAALRASLRGTATGQHRRRRSVRRVASQCNLGNRAGAV